MAETFDPLGFIGDMAASAASGIGSTAQGVASAVGEGVSAAVEAVSNAVVGPQGPALSKRTRHLDCRQSTV